MLGRMRVRRVKGFDPNPSAPIRGAMAEDRVDQMVVVLGGLMEWAGPTVVFVLRRELRRR